MRVILTLSYAIREGFGLTQTTETEASVALTLGSWALNVRRFIY